MIPKGKHSVHLQKKNQPMITKAVYDYLDMIMAWFKNNLFRCIYNLFPPKVDRIEIILLDKSQKYNFY